MFQSLSCLGLFFQMPPLSKGPLAMVVPATLPSLPCFVLAFATL